MAEWFTSGQEDEESALRQYFADIANSTPLSREREAELAARIQSGDLAARNELVEANLRFVIDVAKDYQDRGLSLAELISAGNVGLITAAERFDGNKGFKFISYAVWGIRQAIQQALGEQRRAASMVETRLDRKRCPVPLPMRVRYRRLSGWRKPRPSSRFPI